MDNEDIEETVESEEGTNDVDPDLKAFLDSYETKYGVPQDASKSGI